jgi:hypothetical protein
MSTTSDFPEIHWDKLRQEMENTGPKGVISFIDPFPPSERLNLYSFAQRGFSGREWGREERAKNLDDYMAVVNAGIAEALRQSDEAEDQERKNKLKDFANILSYNLAADLADCWPGDTLAREQKHYEEGLKAAENCIRWRDELEKPPSRRAMAVWAKGMHQLSLRDIPGAVESFRISLDYAVEEATLNGHPTAVGPESAFNIILGAGYLGLAEIRLGTPGGRERYEAACTAFRQQAEGEDGEKKEDAGFGLDQLNHVEQKYVTTP